MLIGALISVVVGCFEDHQVRVRLGVWEAELPNTQKAPFIVAVTGRVTQTKFGAHRVISHVDRPTAAGEGCVGVGRVGVGVGRIVFVGLGVCVAGG